VGLRNIVAAMALTFESEDGVERAAPGLAPTAFRIWHAGPNATDMGEHIFSQASADALMADQAMRGNQYSIDADHMSLNPIAPPESRKAMGWHRLEVRKSTSGPELWAVDVEWTDAVRAGLEKRPPEWRYFSPEYRVNKDGEIDAYLNTAITNNPATWKVTALASKPIAASKGSVRMNYQDIAAALFGDDDEKKKDARKCIAAMSESERKAFEAVKKAAFAEDEPEHEGGDEAEKDAKLAAAEEDEKKAAAQKATEDKEREEAARKAASAATSRELALAARVDSLEAERAARDAKEKTEKETQARAAVFAKRPDIGPQMRASLATMPLMDLEKFVSTLPRVMASMDASTHALLAGGVVTGGERSTGGNPTLARLTRDERATLANVYMQAGPPRGDVVRATRRGSVLEMPMFPPTPEQAKARIKELESELEAHRAEVSQ
jgi:hypothetical protein